MPLPITPMVVGKAHNLKRLHRTIGAIEFSNDPNTSGEVCLPRQRTARVQRITGYYSSLMTRFARFFSSVFCPTPLIFIRSSSRLKGPLASR